MSLKTYYTVNGSKHWESQPRCIVISGAGTNFNSKWLSDSTQSSHELYLLFGTCHKFHKYGLVDSPRFINRKMWYLAVCIFLILMGKSVVDLACSCLLYSIIYIYCLIFKISIYLSKSRLYILWIRAGSSIVKFTRWLHPHHLCFFAQLVLFYLLSLLCLVLPLSVSHNALTFLIVSLSAHFSLVSTHLPTHQKSLPPIILSSSKSALLPVD